jgi:tetratricopeptide (TPR) repeat protein
MPDLLLVLAGLAVAAALVLSPLRHGDVAPSGSADERDAAELRHRVALEALRDVEADRRAGSLDDAAYAVQLADAERRAAETRGALTAAGPAAAGSRAPDSRAPDSRAAGDGRRAGILAAGLIGLALVAGWVVPAAGIANRTVTNQALAAAEAAEDARQDRIRELTDELAADPADTEVLSDLADAYLAGSDAADLSAAARALQLLIASDPERNDAYERIITAYLRAGDAANARAAHDAYAEVASADPIELAFFDGLIARGEGEKERAIAAFDRFLELAPDDPRAEMIAGLRDEAAGSR